MKKYWRDYTYLFSLAGIIILLDQLSKAWVRASLAPEEIWSPWDWLTPYARIVHWYNTGASFGMFQGWGQVFALLSLLVAAAIIFYFPRVPAEDWPLRLAMSLQLGGAVGNLIDRLTVGHVTDFISIGRFPVFNVADSSITVGVVVLIIGVWLQDRKQKEAVRLAGLHGPGSSSDEEVSG